MRRWFGYLASGLFVLVMADNSARADSGMPLLEALRSAETASPVVKGAKFREQAAQEDVGVQNGDYLPQLDAAAIASTGNPGAAPFFGLDQNIGSANRIGEGAGLTLKQNLYDFGRTAAAVQRADAAVAVEKDNTSLNRLNIDLAVLRLYLDCSYLKAQVESEGFIADQARILAQETDRFVKSGQRSVIERYLVDAAAKEATTRIAEFAERVKLVERRLALQIANDTTQSVTCQRFSGIEGQIARLEMSALTESPILIQERDRVHLAEARLEGAKAESRPKLIALASGAYFNSDNLSNKWIYSLGVGITMPLFDGYKVQGAVARESASLTAESAARQASEQTIANENFRFQEQTQALKVRLDYLKNESKLAQEAFELARRRYTSLQGNMTDLREAIRNLARVMQSTDEAIRDLFLARGQRALYNGSRQFD